MSQSVLMVLDTPPFPEWLLESLQGWHTYRNQLKAGEGDRKQESIRLNNRLNVVSDQITQYRSEAEKQAKEAHEREMRYQRWGKEPTPIPSHRPLFTDNTNDVLEIISKMKSMAEQVSSTPDLSIDEFARPFADFYREHIEPLRMRYQDQIRSFRLYERALKRGLNPRTQLANCLPIAQAVFTSHLAHGEVDIGAYRVTQFMTVWGSTSLGFGGMGGAAMTEAVTTAIEHPTGMTCVFYGDRFAFFIETPNELMHHDLEQGVITWVKDAHYYKG